IPAPQEDPVPGGRAGGGVGGRRATGWIGPVSAGPPDGGTGTTPRASPDAGGAARRGGIHAPGDRRDAGYPAGNEQGPAVRGAGATARGAGRRSDRAVRSVT